jgi:hypothetical protein
MAFYPRYHHTMKTDAEFANFVQTNIVTDTEFNNDMSAMDIQYMQVRYQFVVQMWDCYDQIRTQGKTELIPVLKECCRCAIAPLRKVDAVAIPLIESYIDGKFGS